MDTILASIVGVSGFYCSHAACLLGYVSIGHGMCNHEMLAVARALGVEEKFHDEAFASRIVCGSALHIWQHRYLP